MVIVIRQATGDDFDRIWSILEPIVSAGETYALPRDWKYDDAIAYWTQAGHTAFVAVWDGAVVGTYFIHPNQKGGGSHICNCGYATANGEMGKGVGREMCLHSLELAKQHGYKAMQYNFVISSNRRAVSLWQRCGFDIVGRLPGAFNSPTEGFVDVFVMFKNL